MANFILRQFLIQIHCKGLGNRRRMHVVYRYGNRSVVLSCLLDSQAQFAGSRIGGIRIIKYRFDDVVARISWVFVQLFTLDIGITLVFCGSIPVKLCNITVCTAGNRQTVRSRVGKLGAVECFAIRITLPASDRRRRLGDLKAAGYGQALYRDAGRVGARQGGRGRAEILAGLAVLIIDFDCRDLRAAPGGLLAGIYPYVLTIRAVRCVSDFKPHKTAVTVFSTYGIYGGHWAAGGGAFGPDHLGRCGELPVVVVAMEPDRSVLVLRERVPFVRHVGGEDALKILHRLAGGNDCAGFALRGDADFGRGVQGSFDGDGLARGQEHIVIEGANKCAVVIDVFIVAGDAYLAADGEGAGVGGADIVFVIAQIDTAAATADAGAGHIAGDGAAGHCKAAAVHVHAAGGAAGVARDLTAGHIKYGAPFVGVGVVNVHTAASGVTCVAGDLAAIHIEGGARRYIDTRAECIAVVIIPAGRVAGDVAAVQIESAEHLHTAASHPGIVRDRAVDRAVSEGEGFALVNLNNINTSCSRRDAVAVEAEHHAVCRMPGFTHCDISHEVVVAARFQTGYTHDTCPSHIIVIPVLAGATADGVLVSARRQRRKLAEPLGQRRQLLRVFSCACCSSVRS